MSARATPAARSAYRHFRQIHTRWSDNDAYGHVNNVVYYLWFDTVVNSWLVEGGALDIVNSPVIGLVVQTGCDYFSPVSFPQTVTAGLRVGHAGTSSVRYEIAIFRVDGDVAVAQGHFVHVYVDRTTNRPVPLPDALRAKVEGLM